MCVMFKVSASLLKSEIYCNTFPHSNNIFASAHTFVFISLDSLRGPTELSQLQVS